MPAKSGRTWRIEPPLVSIRGDNTQLFEFAPARRATRLEIQWKFTGNKTSWRYVYRARVVHQPRDHTVSPHRGGPFHLFQFRRISYACIFPSQKWSRITPRLHRNLSIFILHRLQFLSHTFFFLFRSWSHMDQNILFQKVLEEKIPQKFIYIPWHLSVENDIVPYSKRWKINLKHFFYWSLTTKVDKYKISIVSKWLIYL